VPLGRDAEGAGPLVAVLEEGGERRRGVAPEALFRRRAARAARARRAVARLPHVRRLGAGRSLNPGGSDGSE
jgi:hypothetical protein